MEKLSKPPELPLPFMSVRLYKGLLSAHIETWRDLEDKTWGDILRIRNIGRESFNEFKEMLISEFDATQIQEDGSWNINSNDYIFDPAIPGPNYRINCTKGKLRDHSRRRYKGVVVRRGTYPVRSKDLL